MALVTSRNAGPLSGTQVSQCEHNPPLVPLGRQLASPHQLPLARLSLAYGHCSLRPQPSRPDPHRDTLQPADHLQDALLLQRLKHLRRPPRHDQPA